MRRCRKKGHVMKCQNVPRSWVNEDGATMFRIYVQVFCDTCRLERQRINRAYKTHKFYKEYGDQRKERDQSMPTVR
jgi:hypothetical protein